MRGLVESGDADFSNGLPVQEDPTGVATSVTAKEETLGDDKAELQKEVVVAESRGKQENNVQEVVQISDAHDKDAEDSFEDRLHPDKNGEQSQDGNIPSADRAKLETPHSMKEEEPATSVTVKEETLGDGQVELQEEVVVAESNG
jgi:hypothetical protein